MATISGMLLLSRKYDDTIKAVQLAAVRSLGARGTFAVYKTGLYMCWLAGINHYLFLVEAPGVQVLNQPLYLVLPWLFP